MAFGSIVSGTTTFADRSGGMYMDQSVGFGAPSNTLKIRSNSNQKSPSCAISRVLQVDYTAPGTTVPKRVSAQVQVIVTAPVAGITATQLDTMVQDISTFLTPGTLTEILQGKD